MSCANYVEQRKKRFQVFAVWNKGQLVLYAMKGINVGWISYDKYEGWIIIEPAPNDLLFTVWMQDFPN